MIKLDVFRDSSDKAVKHQEIYSSSSSFSHANSVYATKNCKKVLTLMIFFKISTTTQGFKSLLSG